MNCGKTLCACKVCVLSLFSHVWFFVIPWTVAHQAPLSMGFSQQECWSGLPCPPPEDLPDSGIEPTSPVSCLHVDSLLLSHQGSPLCAYTKSYFGNIFLFKGIPRKGLKIMSQYQVNTLKFIPHWRARPKNCIHFHMEWTMVTSNCLQLLSSSRVPKAFQLKQ